MIGQMGSLCGRYTLPKMRRVAVQLKQEADPKRVSLPTAVTTPVSPEVKALISYWERQ